MPHPPGNQPNFDRLARPYRWLEYLTLGRALERCRLYLLPQLTDRTQALVLGDGDGRFLARLLQQNPSLHADAVDTSSAMLHLLHHRCQNAAPTSQTRLRLHHTDALAFVSLPVAVPYDLVVTHFFLDCLTQQQVEDLVAATTQNLTPGALWLVSDFRIPRGPMRLPAKALVRGLYFAFRILTGLRITHLPGHSGTLERNRFSRLSGHTSLAGLLRTELWIFNPAHPETASSTRLTSAPEAPSAPASGL